MSMYSEKQAQIKAEAQIVTQAQSKVQIGALFLIKPLRLFRQNIPIIMMFSQRKMQQNFHNISE